VPDDVTVTTMQRSLLREIQRMAEAGDEVTYASLADVLGGPRSVRSSVEPLRRMGLVCTSRVANASGAYSLLALTEQGHEVLRSTPMSALGWGMGPARPRASSEEAEGLQHARLWEPELDELLSRRQILEQLPFEDDDLTRLFVEEHPGGASLEEIGDLLGLTRERVRQIIESALDRLARRGYLAGLHHYIEAA